jgi:excinuclease UvrABC ATPase subunit
MPQSKGLVMDEPTTGPHISDITHLVAIMDRLVAPP